MQQISIPDIKHYMIWTLVKWATKLFAHLSTMENNDIITLLTCYTTTNKMFGSKGILIVERTVTMDWKSQISWNTFKEYFMNFTLE